MTDLERKTGGNGRRAMLGLAGLATAGSLLAGPAQAQISGGAGVPAPGAPGPLRSAGVLAFGPDDVLFVGDVAGSAVHALALRSADVTAQMDVELGNFHNFEGRDLLRGLDATLAALLGTTPDQVVINDLAVHRPSQQVFLSVERGRSTDALPAIVKLNHGKLEVLDLSGVPHTQARIPNEPGPDARLEFDAQRTFAITDVGFHGNAQDGSQGGEVFVSGISNQRFASTLHRIPYPFTAAMTTSTVEIWHPVHGEFETRAPIIRHLVRDVGGVPYLFAVYGCTPLVRIPLAALTDGAHVRGEVIGELGYGSNPLDMMIFTNAFDGKDYLLVTIDTRSASRIAVADLGAATAEPTGGPIDFGPGGLGRTQGLLPIRAEHFAILNDKWAVQVWRHPKTGYRLDVSTVATPYFFERRDGMAEMNWPDGPDPFDYRGHRNEVSRGI